MTCGIYYIQNPNGRLYIGSSMNMDHRWGRYKRLDCKAQPAIYRSLKKYGVDAHEFSILQECSKDDLLVREQMFMDFYKPELNVAKVAACPPSAKGKKRSAETRARMSEAQRGRKHTAASKAKMSASAMGRKVTAATKAKISATQKGRVHTPEAIAKMSASKMGVPQGPHSAASNAKRSATQKGKLWWNNGFERCKSKTQPGPTWVRGRKLR